MSNTYFIADLHGRYDLLEEAISRISAREGDSRHKIVFGGDYVDRGPQSRQIIERLMAGPRLPNQRFVCLQGNHESMMIECIEFPHQIGWWIGNGGGQTLRSYGAKIWMGASFNAEDTIGLVPRNHLGWLKVLPLFHLDQHRLFVHAAADPTKSLEDHSEAIFQWMLYPEGTDVPFIHEGTKRYVVHGHHQFANGPKIYENRADFDTFAWKTGRLVIAVFDDEVPGKPVDTIEVII